MITSLADAERVFGPLKIKLEMNHDTQLLKAIAFDGDEFVRWAGEEYWVEEKEEEETYPCAYCDKEMALHEVNEGCDGWVCDACVEELSSDAEEEEDIDICGETGGLIKGFKGCGDKFDTQDTNMLGNTSFCVECYNKHEDTYYK